MYIRNYLIEHQMYLQVNYKSDINIPDINKSPQDRYIIKVFSVRLNEEINQVCLYQLIL